VNDRHLSTQYDVELSGVCARVLEMGGLVETQVAAAVRALVRLDQDLASEVLAAERRVNEMELEVDRELSSIIVRRQPAARDLRLLLAISRIGANLERAGDEAARMARIVTRQLAPRSSAPALPAPVDLGFEAGLATAQLRKALDAFARMAPQAALDVLTQDDRIDAEFEGLLRRLITYMMEDPRAISGSIDLVFAAKSIERIGDHAKNIAEGVIYIVEGTDVRHRPIAAPDPRTR
jgi:phosphate transport system protein